MFGTGKKLLALQELLEEMNGRLGAKQDEARALQEKTGEQLERTAETLADMKEQVGAHDMAIADMLDSWDELQEEQRKQVSSLQARLLEQCQKEAEELRNREEVLVEAVAACREQLFHLRKAAEASGDEAWGKQLGLAEGLLREKALKAGLQEVGQVGEAYSFDLHEIVDAADTEDPALDQTIAAVYTPGSWYRGKMLCKAKVSVYRRRETEA